MAHMELKAKGHNKKRKSIDTSEFDWVVHHMAGFFSLYTRTRKEYVLDPELGPVAPDLEIRVPGLVRSMIFANFEVS